MNMVYCVIGINFASRELFTDFFENKEDALNAGWKLGSSLTDDYADRHSFVSNPVPMNNGGEDEKIWVFVDTDNAHVAVEYRVVVENNNQVVVDDVGLDSTKLDELKEFIESLSSNTFNHLFDQTSKVLLNDPVILTDTVTPPLVIDDPFADDLPGGFTFDNKPLTVRDIKADPYYVQSDYSLKDSQKAALVIARIRKMPNYYYKDINPVNSRLQSAALEEIKNKTLLGEDIIAFEIKRLEDLIIDLQTDESSSSSSEEEDYSDL